MDNFMEIITSGEESIKVEPAFESYSTQNERKTLISISNKEWSHSKLAVKIYQ